MAYDAKWDSTDQIPQRAIDAGLDRFGSLDPTDGGQTPAQQPVRARGIATATPAPPSCRPTRSTIGSSCSRTSPTRSNSRPGRPVLAAGPALHRRADGQPCDRSPSGWSAGTQRVRRHAEARPHSCRPVARRHSAATSPAPRATTRCARRCWASTARPRSSGTPWLRSIVGLRADQARFNVDSLSNAANSGSASDHLVSPKLSLILGPLAPHRVLLQRRPRLAQQRRTRHRRRWTRRPAMRSTACPAWWPRKSLRDRRAHRMAAGPAELAGTVDARLRFTWGMPAQPTQPSQQAARCRVEQPLHPAALAAGRRRSGLDPRPLLGRRRCRQPNPECRRQGGVDRLHRARPRARGRPACSGATWGPAR